MFGSRGGKPAFAPRTNPCFALRRARFVVLAAAFIMTLAARPGVGAAQSANGSGNGNGLVDLAVTQLPDGAPRPTLDGRVDDEAWGPVSPFTEFTQQEPNEGEPATEKTEVRLLLDRTTLYIGIVNFDSDPSKIVVTQSRRDASLTDTDSIQVILDTFNDNQNGFVFGTDPQGIEYDGQVAAEGQTSGFASSGSAGQAGSQRGQVSGFNPNWDADWTVRSQITDRGWETEMAIPLRTLRYNPGPGRTWGFNVMRNIRRKNEQVFLAPIPRGYGIHRVSMARKVTGLNLPPRRDIKVTPYAAAAWDKDFTASQNSLDKSFNVGGELKWGVTPSLTVDLTVNTDFAQVEVDDEQINLTRFPLFFPEKRPFFLENASTFAFGVPQQIDLFYSRRIGLSSSGLPIDIIGGARMSGKVGGYNVGVLNMQTEKTFDRNEQLVAPGNNFTVARVQREVGRSNFGALFVNRQGTGNAAGSDNYNRAYGIDGALQASQNGRLFAFLARTDSPGTTGSDYAGAVTYSYTNPGYNANMSYSQVGDTFNPEVGFLPRRGFRSVAGRYFLTYDPKSPKYDWIRRFSPHISQNIYYGFDGELQSARGHYHPFEIQPAVGGRFGIQVDRDDDKPVRPFTVYNGADGNRVVIPPGYYRYWVWNAQYYSDPSAPFNFQFAYKWGGFYDGDQRGIISTVGVRVGSRFSGSVGFNVDDIDLPYGSFVNKLVPIRVGYSFTPLTTIQGLIQYNSQTSQLSSNIRFALLNRSGTGLFLVYNDRRDVIDYTADEILGRSFIVKYTRLFNF